MISDYFNKTFTVKRDSPKKSTMGSYEPTSSTIGTFTGFIDLMTKGNYINKVGGQYLENASHVIGCSSTVSWVNANHKIVDASNLIYNVLNNDDPVGRGHHREIIVEYKGFDQLST